jgi:mannose-6-phosphate isomerase
VVLETGADAIIYAGLKPGVTDHSLRQSLSQNKVSDELASFKPNTGDAILIKAGTVHTLGDAVVFEIQENSDVTYRLYDWDRVDKKTGKPRDLQVEEAIACLDFTQTDIKPVEPVKDDSGVELREKVFDNEHFMLWRITGSKPFMVGKDAAPRILVCIEGGGELENNADLYALGKGEVMLVPAVCGACPFVPRGNAVLLEIGLPDKINF